MRESCEVTACDDYLVFLISRRSDGFGVAITLVLRVWSARVFRTLIPG